MMYVPEWDLNNDLVGWLRVGTDGFAWLDDQIEVGDDGLPVVPEDTDYVCFADRSGECFFVPLEQVGNEELDG